MNGAFSFASFAPGRNRAGGWGVGERYGSLDDQAIKTLQSLIPTKIDDGVKLGTYPDSKELTRRTRRYAWLDSPLNPQQRIFVASVNRGNDATGRGANTYSYLAIAETSDDPVNWFYSPAIPAPYGPTETADARIPHGAPTQNGPLADGSIIDAFLDQDHEAITGHFGHIGPTPHNRRDTLKWIVHTVKTADAFTKVVVGAPLSELNLWAAAISRTLGSAFGFTTFERPNTLEISLRAGASFVMVPVRDLTLLSRFSFEGAPVTLINTADAPPHVPDLPDENAQADTVLPDFTDFTGFPGTNPASHTSDVSGMLRRHDSESQSGLDGYNPFTASSTPEDIEEIPVKPERRMQFELGQADYQFIQDASTAEWEQALTLGGGDINRDRVLAYLYGAINHPRLEMETRTAVCTAMIVGAVYELPWWPFGELDADEITELRNAVADRIIDEGAAPQRAWRKYDNSELKALLDDIAAEVMRRRLPASSEPRATHRNPLSSQVPGNRPGHPGPVNL
ncbi:hypothetical protein QP027_11090 [Corynebacterium breve]|uniref:GTPase-associated protein 1 N-terminal domain-containing protein n=1 Tax=Corynebacterium breve TaxID=3049799 RepID=A0ABY8VJC3_9CORY|nr:hypothetical protein [Corynebacterium breve]WIM69081.1 hypothetical protein QP027_11090 [Corynebacterium breve]